MRGKARKCKRGIRETRITPPMRGKAKRKGKNCKNDRITPAYAGKSDFVAVHKFIFEDHPRLCGEKSISGRTYAIEMGSPPPMRGKVINVQCWFNISRITPAYAGKRKSLIRNSFIHQDHPRLCGEKVSTTANATQQAGSPPPMRGKAFDANGDVTAAGITPAYAGKRAHR